MQDDDPSTFCDKKKTPRVKNQSKASTSGFHHSDCDSLKPGYLRERELRNETTDETLSTPGKSCTCSGDFSVNIISNLKGIAKGMENVRKKQDSPEVSCSPSFLLPEMDNPFLEYKPQLESVIADQNILIETLREKLMTEKEKSDLAVKELHDFKQKSSKEIKNLETELADTKKSLVEKEEQISKQNITKNEIDGLHSFYRESLKDLEEKNKAEVSCVDTNYKEKLSKILDKQSFKEVLYEKQIDLMKKQIEDMHHKTLLKGDELFIDEDSDKEIERLKTSLEKLGSLCSSSSLPEHVVSFADQLAASIANEINLKAELQSFKKQNRDLLSQIDSLKKKLNNLSLNESMYESKFIDLEHDLDVCNHDRDELFETVDLLSAQKKNLEGKCERLKSEIQDYVSNFSSDMVILSDVMKDFNKEFNKMISYYGEKLTPKLIEFAKFSQFDDFEINPGLPVSGSKPEVNTILKYIEDSRHGLCKLNETVKIYYFYNTVYCKKQEELDEKLKCLKNEFISRENNYEGKISQLHKKLMLQIGEIKELENELLKYQKDYVLKFTYDNLLNERNSLFNQLKEIEMAVKRLEGSKFFHDMATETLCDRVKELVHFVEECAVKDSAPRSSQFLPLNNKVLSPSECHEYSVNTSESPSFHGKTDFATSTPFRPKAMKEPVKVEEVTSLKSSLLEWIEKCGKFNLENGILKTDVYELKFQLNQVNFSKQVLEEEIKVLNSKIELLQSKVEDYLVLKEKCKILENDNDALNFQIKYVLNNQTVLSEESINSMITKMDPIVPPSSIEGCNKNNLLQELSFKNYEIICLQEKCKALGKENAKIKLKLISGDEIIASLKKNIKTLISEVRSDQEQLHALSEEKIQLSSQNKVFEVEINSLKSRIDYLASLKRQELGDGDSVGLVQKLQEDSLNCFKEVIDKMCEIEKLKLTSLESPSADHLDARHHVEILLKNNSQLQNEKEDLLQRCCELQEMIHRLQQVSEGMDPGWLIQLEKLELGLINEVKQHREQHARIEEALRSTGHLHNELQKQSDIIRNKCKEIAGIQKRLEEEKFKSKNIEVKNTMLDKSLKEKENVLETILKEKKSLEETLGKMEEDFVRKELRYMKDLLHSQWECKTYRIKVMEAQVLKESDELKHLGDIPNGDELSQSEDLHKRIVLHYHRSVDSLAHYWESDKAQLLAEQQATHTSKVKQLVETMNALSAKVETLEADNLLLNLGSEKLSTLRMDSDLMDNKKKLDSELKELESSLSEEEKEIFLKIKSKFKEYTDHQIFSSILNLKEGNKKHCEIMASTLNELHSEEQNLMVLKFESEKHTEMYQLSQEQLKNEKDLINLFSKSAVDLKNSFFDRVKEFLIKEFLNDLKCYIGVWQNSVLKESKKLEASYEEYFNQLKGTNFMSIDTEEKVEWQRKLKSLTEDELSLEGQSNDFIKGIKDYYEHFLDRLDDFVSKSLSFIKETVIEMKTNIEINAASEVALLEEIKSLKNEKEALEKQHRAAVELLIKGYEEEFGKIKCLVDELNKSKLSSGESAALVSLRAELEEKHKNELVELRTYFEQKCVDMERHYSEEIFSQHSRKMSLSSSCTEGELDLIEDTQGQLELPESSITNINKSEVLEERLLEDNCSFKEMLTYFEINSEEFENCFTSQEAMVVIFELYKSVILRVISEWKNKYNILKKSLEEKIKKELDRLEREAKERACLEEKVQEVVRDVREESSREIEWLNVVGLHDALRRCDFTDVGGGDGFILGENLPIDLKSSKSKLSSIVVPRIEKGTETSWTYFHNSEDRPSNEARAIEGRWENKYVDDMSSFMASHILNKVKFEEEVKKCAGSLEDFMKNKTSLTINKLESQLVRLSDLETKLNDFISNTFEDTVKMREEFVCEQEALEVKYNNLVNQIEIKAKESFDEMKASYDDELAKLSSAHENELKTLEKMLKNEIDLLKEKGEILPAEVLNEEEIYEKAKEHAISHVLDGIVAFITNKDELDEAPLPPELKALESLLSSKYQKMLDNLQHKHAEEINELSQRYESQLKTHPLKDKERDVDDVNYSSENEELQKIIHERDCLKQLAETLKGAVSQLASYLYRCEDELNRTVVDELLKMGQNTPSKFTGGSPSPLFSQDSTPVRRVHFAPNITDLIECLSDNTLTPDKTLDISGVSTHFRTELETCLRKLKEEAAAILGLSSARGDNCLESLPSVNQPLQEKARRLLNEKEFVPKDILALIEELAIEGDKVITDLRKDNDDLLQQVIAADKQLKNTRKFLEDQAAEREFERDEYNREVMELQAAIKDKDSSSRHKINLEVEDLEERLNDVVNQLKSSEEQKKDLENELKTSSEKVWALTDVIHKLESQLLLKSEREECLEKRLDELEVELEQQSIAQQAMAHEMESLKSRGDPEESYVEQVMQLQEEIKQQYGSNSVRQIKMQLQDIEKVIDGRIKELESLNLSSSTTSLSSPSEEISIRDHLESFRCQTPDFCPSPVALPVEDVNRLLEKTQKHIRAEEMIIKKMKDQQLQIRKISQLLGDLQAERDVLQNKVDKSKSQLVEANSKIDDLRRKADAVQVSANKSLLEKVSELEEAVRSLQHELDVARSEMLQKDEELIQARSLIESQGNKLRSGIQGNSDLVDALRLELASVITKNNKLEELIEKYKNERDPLELSPLYDCLLADKNEDIQQLQKTVSFLQNQQIERGHRSASMKGVSFANDLSSIQISPLQDCVLRDVPLQEKSLGHMSGISRLPVESTAPFAAFCQKEFSEPPDVFQNERIEEDKISQLEFEVEGLKSMVDELTNAKKDVETCIASFSEERKFYEDKLNKLLEEKKSQEEEILKLRETIAKKDTEIDNTTADVNKLQVILGNLQGKLKQASDLASKDSIIKEELSKWREKCSTLEKTLDDFNCFKRKLAALNEDFNLEKEEPCEYLHSLIEILRCKLQTLSDSQLLIGTLNQESNELKIENTSLSDEIKQLKKKLTQVAEVEVKKLKERIHELTERNLAQENIIAQYERLKLDKNSLLEQLEALQLERGKLKNDLEELKLINVKLLEEIQILKEELEKNGELKEDCEQIGLIEEAGAQVSSKKVPGLEDLTNEIEKQLDLSAQLDHSLLLNIGKTDKKPLLTPIVVDVEEDLQRRLIEETNKWKVLDQKQSHLTNQLDNLTRLVSSQDNRIRQLSVQLDEKKNQCLVLELDVLNLKQVHSLLENERQRARAIQKEDTNLIESLRVRLESALKSETTLKSLLLEERQKCDTLQACLNSARALEKYVRTSQPDTDSESAKNYLKVRVELEQMRDVNRDLEDVITRERHSQKILKDKLRTVEQQKVSLEKELKILKAHLNTEIKSKESLETKLMNYEKELMKSKVELFENKLNKNHVRENLTELNQWKEECLDLREHLRKQREQEDQWAINVQTPLMRQLNDVNKSLETLVREKITLQAHVNDLEKERDFLRERICQLEEIARETPKEEDYLSIKPLSRDQPFDLNNAQSLNSKLERLMDLYQRGESHRKALIWQKRYLLVALNGYQRAQEDTILRLHSPPISLIPPPRKRYSFRVVVITVSAAIKLNCIHKRKAARRKQALSKLMRPDYRIITSPKSTRRTIERGVMSHSPPSRDLYAPPRVPVDENISEPSKLNHYVTMFDEMQKRLGKILQDVDN